MIPDGMKSIDANKKLRQMKLKIRGDSKFDKIGSGGRLEELRKLWAKECGVDYVRRQGPIGIIVEEVERSSEDVAEDKAGGKSRRGRAVGRAVAGGA